MATRWLEDKNISLSIANPDPISVKGAFDYYESASAFFDAQKSADIIVIAVKPNIVPDICAELQNKDLANTCIISVAAGRTLDFYAGQLPATQSVIWAIPNSAAAVGESMSVYCANKNVTAEQEAGFRTLFTPLGAVAKLDDQNLMHAVIALASSGPAFYYLFAEYMERAAQDAGLSAALAKQMQQQVLRGAGAMVAANPDTPFSSFREAITSPQGTTAAGVSVFEQNDALKKLVLEAGKAAENRSKELS